MLKLSKLLIPDTFIFNLLQSLDNGKLIQGIVDTLIDYLDNLNDKDIDSFFIPELMKINLNGNYTELIIILIQIQNLIIKRCQEYDLFYESEFATEISLNQVLSILNDSSLGSMPITWQMIGPIGDYIKEEFYAYNITNELWELMKLYTEDSIGNEYSYTFEYCIDPIICEIKYPFCDVSEVSDTITVQGNHICSSCDTYGTQFGVKSESLYAFYIVDINKYAIVTAKFYCL